MDWHMDRQTPDTYITICILCQVDTDAIIIQHHRDSLSLTFWNYTVVLNDCAGQAHCIYTVLKSTAKARFWLVITRISLLWIFFLIHTLLLIL